MRLHNDIIKLLFINPETDNMNNAELKIIADLQCNKTFNKDKKNFK